MSSPKRNLSKSTFGYGLAAIALAATLALVGAPRLLAKDAPAKTQPDIDGVWLAVPTGGGSPGPAWPADKMTPLAKQASAAFKAKYGPDIPEAGSYCVHAGLPTMMTSSAGYPIEIISGKKQINITVETGSFRRIFLDGRRHPAGQPPTSVGHSVGRWEGGVLVVETTNLEERVDSRVISDQARVTERIYLIDDKGESRGGIAAGMQTEKNGKMLVDEITIVDPKFYTEPLKFLGNFRRAPDESVLEYDCGREFWDAALEEHLKKRKK